MKILAIGDIVGRPGRTFLSRHLDALQKEEGIDFTFANGENAASGVGITRSVADELFDMGIDVLTSGNHIWDKKEVLSFIGEEPRLLRPANYPASVPGRGSGVFRTRGDGKLGLLNVSGRVFSGIHYSCPFQVAREEIGKLKKETPVVILDFHAEATSEKVAMGHYLDGLVSCVVGTHTHVQTADELVLPGGTAYITDIGMTGPWLSVIGVKTDLVVHKFLHQLPVRFEVAKGPCQINAVVVEVDEITGRSTAIRRVFSRESA